MEAEDAAQAIVEQAGGATTLPEQAAALTQALDRLEALLADAP
jgi:hypothetical protein